MQIPLTPIGAVRNGRHDPRDAGWGALESTLELHAEYRCGLAGLESWSHVIVVTWLHLDPDGETPPADWRRHPRGRSDLPRLGVFAQRGRMRPNPIGITTCAIVGVSPDALVVRGLDAVDGTPLLDLKPHARVLDTPDSRLEPGWFTVMMQDYFVDDPPHTP